MGFDPSNPDLEQQKQPLVPGQPAYQEVNHPIPQLNNTMDPQSQNASTVSAASQGYQQPVYAPPPQVQGFGQHANPGHPMPPQGYGQPQPQYSQPPQMGYGQPQYAQPGSPMGQPPSPMGQPLSPMNYGQPQFQQPPPPGYMPVQQPYPPQTNAQNTVVVVNGGQAQ